VNPGQREAVLRAALLELAAKGYRALSLAELGVECGVSEAELIAEFGDLDGCLSSAYELIAAQTLAAAGAACDTEMPWPERVQIGLSALVDRVAANPQLAQAMTRAFPGIRPATYGRYVELLAGFVPLMKEGREYSQASEELPAEVELLAVGAAESIIFGELDAGRAEELPAMVPEILFSVLVPFIGPERAADEMQSAATAR
jgi:AcrR family transcriptional regulator